MNKNLIIREVNRQASRGAPYLVWNAFVDLLAMSDYKDLNSIQRLAYLAFWYDAEMQNGGHLQYFENQAIYHLEETLVALDQIGASKQSGILNTASKKFVEFTRGKFDTVEKYIETALNDDYGEFDTAYYDCIPTIQSLLEKYLHENMEQFIEFQE